MKRQNGRHMLDVEVVHIRTFGKLPPHLGLECMQAQREAIASDKNAGLGYGHGGTTTEPRQYEDGRGRPRWRCTRRSVRLGGALTTATVARRG